MAKFVVAGHADCPYLARVELLGDKLAKSLEKFELHKIFVQPEDWEQWLKNTCQERGWEFSKSPIVWRELIDRGGKGVLIGDANDFQEYVKAYYDVESGMNSYDMRTIAKENKVTKRDLDEEERLFKSHSKPLNVCISNAIHPIAYHLLTTLTSGQVLGINEEVNIRLLCSYPDEADIVQGMAMEVEDLAHGLMREVEVYTNPYQAFENCSLIIFLDELVQEKEERKMDWLERNAEFFSDYATIVNEQALKNCKVLLSGLGPINFNAMIMINKTPNLQRQNIVAVSTIVENMAKSVIGERLNVNPAGVVDLIVWGNINGNHYFDISKCRVHNYNGAVWGPHWYSVDAKEMIHDNNWVVKEFPGLVEARSQKISAIINHSTSLSAGNAICTALKHWFQGSPLGQIFSLGVYSEGWYGIPQGLVISLPVTMDPKGYWHVIQDIELTQTLKEALNSAIEDLKKEIRIFTGECIEAEPEGENVKEDLSAAAATNLEGNVDTDTNNTDANATENTNSAEDENKQEGDKTDAHPDSSEANEPTESQPAIAEEQAGENTEQEGEATKQEGETTEQAGETTEHAEETTEQEGETTE